MSRILSKDSFLEDAFEDVEVRIVDPNEPHPEGARVRVDISVKLPPIVRFFDVVVQPDGTLSLEDITHEYN